MTVESKMEERVYVYTGHSYIEAVAIKRTPKGLVDVRYVLNVDMEPIRFRADGRRVGGDRWDREELDVRVTFEQRKALLAEEHRARLAAAKLCMVFDATTNGRPRHGWGKEGLLCEVDRLQLLLNEAKALVEAI